MCMRFQILIITKCRRSRMKYGDWYWRWAHSRPVCRARETRSSYSSVYYWTSFWYVRYKLAGDTFNSSNPPLHRSGPVAGPIAEGFITQSLIVVTESKSLS